MSWELRSDGCYCNGSKTSSCGGQSNGTDCRKCCANIMPYFASGGGEKINPASSFGAGFDTSFDGRVRGGIKTPNMTRRATRTTEFNIFDRQHETATNDYNSNAPNSITKGGRRLVKIHPLDIVKASRSIGENVYDPISNKWKIDDGRPRGYFEDEETGERNWACWGKCKTRSRAGLFGGSSSSRCKCERSTDRCRCDGCMDDQAC